MLKVENTRQIFHNGEHNAFTDLCRYQGHFYLTFRSCPDGHMVHPTSRILILRSPDGIAWEKVHEFSVPLRDTRDPHFLIFKNRLRVLTGTWYCGESSPKAYDMNQQLGYGVESEDGRAWTEPVMLEGTFGHYIWRAAAYDGVAYLCGRRKSEFHAGSRQDRSRLKSIMLESDDGYRWTPIARFQETWGDETAFVFDDAGKVTAVCRRGSEHAELATSSPPYTTWQRSSLQRYIGGPLLVQWGPLQLVGGRKSTSAGPRTFLAQLQTDGQGQASLRDLAILPSGGDCSYPGLVVVDSNRAWVSWYSSHETDQAGKPKTAIYMAELILSPVGSADK